MPTIATRNLPGFLKALDNLSVETRKLIPATTHTIPDDIYAILLSGSISHVTGTNSSFSVLETTTGTEEDWRITIPAASGSDVLDIWYYGGFSLVPLAPGMVLSFAGDANAWVRYTLLVWPRKK